MPYMCHVLPLKQLTTCEQATIWGRSFSSRKIFICSWAPWLDSSWRRPPTYSQRTPLQQCSLESSPNTHKIHYAVWLSTNTHWAFVTCHINHSNQMTLWWQLIKLYWTEWCYHEDAAWAFHSVTMINELRILVLTWQYREMSQLIDHRKTMFSALKCTAG